MTTQFRVVQSDADFQLLKDHWNPLLVRSEANTIFLTWEWVSAWWAAYGAEHGELYVITAHEASGELVGIAPLYRKVQSWLPLRPIRALHFIGDGSWDSDYLDIILAKGREEETLRDLWSYLEETKSAWDVFQFAGIPEGSPSLRWIDRLDERGQAITRSTEIPCLVTDFPESWESYLSSLKPRFRTKVRSTLREVADRDYRFYTIESREQLKPALGKLFELHEKRWAMKGTSGVFGKPSKRRFYELFAGAFLDRGWLAFDVLDLDGRPAACQMCFRYEGAQLLLQEGFDPEFASESVGIALRAMVFQKAIEQGVKHYDFLAGLGRHKTQWQVRTKQCRSVAAGRKTLQNTIYLKTPAAMDALRERIKSALPTKVLELRRRFAAS